MGCFDTVKVVCPFCDRSFEIQSKAHDCALKYYVLEDAPISILGDLIDYSRKCPGCGAPYKIIVQKIVTVDRTPPEDDEDEIPSMTGTRFKDGDRIVLIRPTNTLPDACGSPVPAGERGEFRYLAPHGKDEALVVFDNKEHDLVYVRMTDIRLEDES